MKFFLFCSFLQAQLNPVLPQFFTVEGRLFNAGAPVDETVDILLEVLPPLSAPAPMDACVLYSEVHTKNVSSNDVAAKGVFAVPLGGGSVTYVSSVSMAELFSNSGGALIGVGACSYAPSSGDARRIRVSVRPTGGGSYSVLSPDTNVSPVPTAMVADSLRGLGPLDFYRNTVVGGQAKLDALLAINAADIANVISGNSTEYVTTRTNGGAALPSFAGDPMSPSVGDIWYDVNNHGIRFQTSTGAVSIGVAGAGVQSLNAGSGVLVTNPSSSSPTVEIASGGITSAHIMDGTIATSDIEDSAVTDIKLASGIDATKITTGVLPMGVVPAGTDTTKLPLNGSVAMTGALDLGVNNLLNTGHIVMSAQRTITIGRYDAGQQTTLIGTLNGSNEGVSWYNTTTDKLMYWNGSAALEVSETTTAGGDITAVNTNAGSGLTGGAISGPVTLAINVDGSSLEVAMNTVQVKDLGIDTNKLAAGAVTNGKLAVGAVTSDKILDGEIANADINASAAIAWSKISKSGAAAADIGAVATGRIINTNTGSGLTGGGNLNADRSLAINVDNSTIEIATNTVQLKDGGITASKIANSTITDVKISAVSVNKITSALGQYFSYAPNGGACTNGEVLKKTINGWECGTDATGVTDHGLLTGLGDDDHTQYVKLAGRAGGQNLQGGTAAGNNLILESTANATKGFVLLQPNGGNVGIGTITPATRLDVEGTIQIGDGGETCSIAANAGMVKYAAGALQYCNGSAWQTLGVSGAGLTTLNLQTGSTQTFQTGGAGLAPTWSSSANVHTLNIPLASGAGVTSGTISKADYDTFTAKLSSVTGTTLTSARLWVGDGSNNAQPVMMNGDATMSSNGAVTIANSVITTAKILDGTITDADINATGINVSKISSASGFFSYKPGGADCAANEVLKWSTASGGQWICGTDNSGVSPWSVAGGDIYYNSGNVGIGTASPSQQLHLHKNSGVAGLKITNGASGAAADLYSTGGEISLRSINNYPLTFAVNNNELMRFHDNGVVAIGTSNPSAGSKLQVDGYIQLKGFSTSGIKFDDGSIMTTASAPSTGVSGAGDINILADTDTNNTGQINIATKGATRIHIANDGNVGIGTLSGTEKLEVLGNVKISGGLTIGNHAGACSAGLSGTMRSVAGAFEFCDGVKWNIVPLQRGVNGKFFKTAGPHTWTIPPGVTSVKVTVIGGGGGYNTYCSGGGGNGGSGVGYFTNLNGGDLTITVGAAGGGTGGSTKAPNGESTVVTYSSPAQSVTATGGEGEYGDPCSTSSASGTFSVTGIAESMRLSLRDEIFLHGGGGNSAVALGEPGLVLIEW